jgi:predicted O-methyltransferase YrrM
MHYDAAMSQDLWTKVDEYINHITIKPDAALDAASASALAANLPPISVTPAHGKLLHLIARAHGAKRILEIGTLAGYSTIWLARAVLPNGQVISLESNAAHAQIARDNMLRAGLTGRVQIRLGDALETLPQLAAEKQQPFDFTFIDADRANLAEYFDWAVRLSRPGSLIVVDNVVRKGGVIDASSDDINVKGVRRFNERLAVDTRVTATMVQTVSSKGYDGFALALVL